MNRVKYVISTLQEPITFSQKQDMLNRLDSFYSDILALQRDYFTFAAREEAWQTRSKICSENLEDDAFDFLDTFNDDAIKKTARGKMATIIETVTKDMEETFEKERETYSPRVMSLINRVECDFFFPSTITVENFLRHLVKHQTCMTPFGVRNAASCFPTLYKDPRKDVQNAIAMAVQTINVVSVFASTNVNGDARAIDVGTAKKVINFNLKGPQLVIDKCVSVCSLPSSFNADCNAKNRPDCKYDYNCDVKDSDLLMRREE
jgi:hypothetical protein